MENVIELGSNKHWTAIKETLVEQENRKTQEAKRMDD